MGYFNLADIKVMRTQAHADRSVNTLAGHFEISCPADSPAVPGLVQFQSGGNLLRLEKHWNKGRKMTESVSKPKGTSQASRSPKSPAKPKPQGKASSRGSEAKPLKTQLAVGERGSANGAGDTPILSDWREATLARMRALILEAEPGMIEERKWKKASNQMAGVPVWSHNGIVCTGETYQKVVKLTFARGASIPDPSHLFNASLEGNTRRAIDIPEGTQVDAGTFKRLVQAAVAQNGSFAKQTKVAKKAQPVASESKPSKVRDGKKAAVVLLSGGNPQIAKADGEAPVQAYIAAMPGWKSDIGKRLDALTVRNVPHVRKAVKWNSPFYGIEGQGWFLTFHVLTRYVKVTFFNGTSLQPVPPGCTPKSKDARWLDIYEGDELDEVQLANWVKQAAALPGWLASSNS